MTAAANWCCVFKFQSLSQRHTVVTLLFNVYKRFISDVFKGFFDVLYAFLNIIYIHGLCLRKKNKILFHTVLQQGILRNGEKHYIYFKDNLLVFPTVKEF